MIFVAFLFGLWMDYEVFVLRRMRGIIFDAPVIRVLLVPSLMKLLGDWNWCMPSWTRMALFLRHPEPAGEPATESA